jgi:hypothetical protein
MTSTQPDPRRDLRFAADCMIGAMVFMLAAALMPFVWLWESRR